jgi:hypothetical protein
MAVFCQLALERPGLEINTSANRWSDLSAYRAAVTMRMSFN